MIARKRARTDDMKAFFRQLKKLLRFILGCSVVGLTGATIFIATQSVLAQPLEHATAQFSLFSKPHLCTE